MPPEKMDRSQDCQSFEDWQSYRTLAWLLLNPAKP
jgi:hypothetical protein